MYVTNISLIEWLGFETVFWGRDDERLRNLE